MATGGPLSKWRELKGVIAAGQTVEIHRFKLDDFLSINYFHDYYTPDVHYHAKQAAIKISGQLSDSLYNEMGDTIDLGINLDEISTEGVLSVTNNEGFAVSYKVLFSLLNL